MIESLFPPETQLSVDEIQVQTDTINIYARRRFTKAQCPDCQQMSEKIHSHYQRHPHDLPCFGFRVQLHLKVRRFFCYHSSCARGTFAETFPELVCRKARRTQRLCQQQLAVAFAVSGEAGRHLLPSLAMPLSGDTLIRDIRRSSDEVTTTPRVLGIDELGQQARPFLWHHFGRPGIKKAGRTTQFQRSRGSDSLVETTPRCGNRQSGPRARLC